MPRRWAAVVAVGVALVGLACKAGTGTGGPTSTPIPNTDFPSSMAALGDSVTAAYGSCLAPTSCPRNSWSTGDGTQVDSQYRRIVSANPAMKGHARNLAVPGARVADLAAQARSVPSTVEYVTLQIGGNDACRSRIADMTSVAQFRDSLDAALSALKKATPHARVLVASIPDIYRVWLVGHTRTIPPKVWAAGICPSLLANSGSTAAADVSRRATFRARIDAYNSQLSAACAAYGSRCRYDGGAVHAVAFTVDQLSAIDFFHPNASGQNEIADATYPKEFNW